MMASTKVIQRPATQSRIPRFATVEEEAEFWDTHDITEFDDELETVTDARFIGLKRDGTLLLWLEPEAAATLSERAAREGTTPGHLARRWVLEHLKVQPDTE